MLFVGYSYRYFNFLYSHFLLLVVSGAGVAVVDVDSNSACCCCCCLLVVVCRRLLVLLFVDGDAPALHHELGCLLEASNNNKQKSKK